MFATLWFVMLLCWMPSCYPSENDALLTGESCSNSTDCSGPNIFCNNQKHCECDFTYWPVQDQTNVSLKICEKYRCEQESECVKMFGTNTTCDDFNQCSCQLSFDYLPESRVCSTSKTALHDPCGSWKQCGKYASCKRSTKDWTDSEKEVNGVCECLVGFKPTNQ